MPNATRSWWFSALASLVLGLGTGYAAARYMAATRMPSAGSAVASATATDVSAETAATSATVAGAATSKSPVKAATSVSGPLPPAGTPVADVFESLSARARAGDALAARRLADDLMRCIERERDLRRAEMMLNRADRRAEGEEPVNSERETNRLVYVEKTLARRRDADHRCAQLSAETIASAGEWLRQAALNGDADARLCYAMAPNEWGPPLMTPAWQQWSARWQQEAPQQLRIALESGVPEAAAALSRMYTPYQPLEGRPWGGLLGDDPYQAYVYALVAQGSLQPAIATYWNGIAATLGARLNAERLAAAQSLANQMLARVRAAPAPSSGPENPDVAVGLDFCRRVRERGGVY
ncbi:MAG: hypothetical protein ABI411_16415 [Tahibacter sp.]